MITQKTNHTLDEYVALRKDWNERDVDIDTVSNEEAEYCIKLLTDLINLTGLTDNEIVLIAKCRIHNISKDVGKYARLLVKQQKERNELLKETEY